MTYCNGSLCKMRKECRYCLPEDIQRERRAKGERFKSAKRQPCFVEEK